MSWDEVDSVHPLLIVDFEQGTDKIGLRDGSGDWNGKTIIAVQGTGSLSSHTLLFMGKSERGADTDGYVCNNGRRIVIISVIYKLAKNIEFLAKSLGFNTNITIRIEKKNEVRL